MNKSVDKQMQEVKDQVASWTEEEKQAYIQQVTEVYTNRKKANKLGDFSFDDQNVYYWHVKDDDSTKLQNRLALGWGYGNREDAKRAGLTDERIADMMVDGDSAVEMSHKSSRALLLKMPKEKYITLQKIKESIRQNRPLKDDKGNPVNTKVTSEDNKNVVQVRREQAIQLED